MKPKCFSETEWEEFLEEKGACLSARNFCKGLTSDEAFEKCTNIFWLDWAINHVPYEYRKHWNKTITKSTVSITIENGNCTYYCSPTQYKVWRKYDQYGNCVHYQNSAGYEVSREYDQYGNVTHHRDSTGYEVWKEYNEHSTCIHYRDCDGQEWKK